MPELTDMQEKFVLEYLIDLNGAQAAIRAGCTPKSARQVASKWLTKDNIRAAIQKEMDRRAERTRINADKVLTELALVAFSDITHYEVNERGRLMVVPELATAVRAVSVVKRKTRVYGKGDDQTEETDVEIRLWPKVAALETLAKHLGLLKDKVEVTGKDGAPLEMNEEQKVGRLFVLLQQARERMHASLGAGNN